MAAGGRLAARPEDVRRGGGVRFCALEEAMAEGRYSLEPSTKETPEMLYERRWAQTLMDRVVDRVAGEMEEQRFDALKHFLLGEKGEVSYESVATQLVELGYAPPDILTERFGPTGGS